MGNEIAVNIFTIDFSTYIYYNEGDETVEAGRNGGIALEEKASRAAKKCAAFCLAGALYAALWRMGFPCLLRRWTGIPCPGCGMSRALWAFLSGEWGRALRLHPMVFALPVLAGEIWRDGRLLRRPGADHAVLWGIAAGFLICYAMRLAGVWLAEI